MSHTPPADSHGLAAITSVEGPEGPPTGLGHSLASWRTVASFGFAVIVLAVVVWKGGLDPTNIWHHLRHANWAYFVAGFVVYYCTFPLRGLRWRILLTNAYRDEHGDQMTDMHVRGLTEIIFISFFVNCVVPAKLGDLYRAYLAKLWQGLSWVKTVGTVVAERIVDIVVLAGLLAGSGLLAFHDQLGKIQVILYLGLALAVVGVLALIGMRTLSVYLNRVIPQRFVERYAAFEEGTLLSLRQVPLVVGLTIPIWLLEGLRYWFMFHTLGIALPGNSFPFAAALFFALGTAVLTTIPATPGGLGIVQGGLIGIMTLLNVNKNDAGAVVILDSLLSYWSIALIGFVVYLVSRRSHFRASGVAQHAA